MGRFADGGMQQNIKIKAIMYASFSKFGSQPLIKNQKRNHLSLRSVKYIEPKDLPCITVAIGFINIY